MQMDRFYNDDEFLAAEYKLLEDSLLKTPHLLEGSKRHISQGFDRRLLMMQTSRILLREKTNPAARRPLSPYLVEELNVHLNSYYLNLRGCCDNLAWALNYELSLVDADEAKGKYTRIDLFGRDFLKALEQKNPKVRLILQAFEPWAADLKLLRDPAAHRVPLSVVGGCLPPEHTSEFDRLWAKAAAPQSELGGHSRSYFVQQAYDLLVYSPLLKVGNEARDISVQIGNDHHHFLMLARQGLDELWKLPANNSLHRSAGQRASQLTSSGDA
jgi:hypothetical protein